MSYSDTGTLCGRNFSQNRLYALLRLTAGINHGRKRPLILTNDNHSPSCSRPFIILPYSPFYIFPFLTYFIIEKETEIMIIALILQTLIILAIIGGIAASRWLYRHGAFSQPTYIDTGEYE